jgi:iron complex outermembrane recepter protein
MKKNDRRPRLACFLLPAAIVAAPVLAQTSKTGNDIDEIVVTATMIERTLDNVPAAVSVVGEDEIQFARQQLGLDEALDRVPGLFIQDRYNFAQDLRISIRGFGARAQFGIRGVKVLVDGIPETLPDGQGSVDAIDLGATSQIEVIRGPSSSMYGNASGGVISIVSEGAGPRPFAEARVSSGSYGFEKLQFKTGGQTDKLNYLVSVSDMTYDGWRAQSRAVNKQLTGRFDIDLEKDRHLLTIVNYTDQPQSDDAGGLTAALAASNPRSAWPANVLYDAGEALTQTRLGFVYSMPVGSHGAIKARNYYAWRDFSNLLPTLSGGSVDLTRAFGGGGFTYSHDGTWLDRPNRLVAGFDFDDQDDDRLRYDNLQGALGPLTFDQNEHVTSHGAFVQNELSLNPKARLTLGARFDNVKFDVTDHFLADGNDSGAVSFDRTSPMIGIVFDFAKQLNLYATYSSSFETPTTTEFNKEDGSGGFNQSLKPQIARNLEVGLRGSLREKQRYEISVFRINVDDELIPYESPVAGRNYYRNAGKSGRKGVEFSWTSSPTDRLETTLSYTYSDFTFTDFIDASGNDFDGKLIPGTAKNVLYGELTYRTPKGWFASGELVYADKQFGDNANTVPVDSYTLGNLRLGYEADLGDFTVSPFLGVNNLFSETYTANVRLNAFGGRYFEPGPPRNGYAGVTLNWKFH